eukprot:SAG31_NODE_10694_length_1109_cov_1.007921_1_plen_245_part_00
MLTSSKEDRPFLPGPPFSATPVCSLPQCACQLWLSAVSNRTIRFAIGRLWTGLVTGLKPGGFTYSNDARCQGGKLLDNIVTMLLTGAQTPGQHARRVFERAHTFDDAIKLFESSVLVDEVYYIVGGVKAGEGAIVTRDRVGAADVWRLGSKNSGPEEPTDAAWFNLQTNYDHWELPPSSDDRRAPGVQHMLSLGSAGVGTSGLLQVLKAWPTFNHHTDYTSVMSAADSTWNSTVWMGDTLSENP